MDAAVIGPIAVIAFIIVCFVSANLVGKRMTGTSKKDQETIRRLHESGGKARATILSATPTGVTIKSHQHQVQLQLSLEPLDGSPRFEGTKKVFLMQTQFPRVGDVWPSWYDRNDPTVFALGAPLQLDAEQIPVFREFGIPHPLDQGPDAPSAT